MLLKIVWIVILLLEVVGMRARSEALSFRVLAYYTIQSHLVTAVSILLALLFGEGGFVTVLRYLSSCMLLMTMVVTVCVLVPMGGDKHKLLFSGSGLYHHLIIPVLSICVYLVLEEHAGPFRIFLIPAMLTLVYGFTMLRLNAMGLVDGPYPFFRVKDQTAGKTALWMAVLTAAVAILSILVWFTGSVVRP